MYTAPHQPRPFQFLVVMMAIIAVVVLAAVAVSTQDPLWFWPRFSAQPERIVITYHGEETTLDRQHPDYDRLVQVLNRTLSGVDRWEEIGISTSTLDEYRTGQAMILEAFYAEPQRIHSPFAIGRFNCLLLPLEGTHAQRRVVFVGAEGSYRAGALALKDTTALHDTVKDLAAR